MYPYKVFGLFYLYGLMISIGLLLAFVTLFHYGKKKKIETRFIDFIFYNGIAAITIGFGSSALFQGVYNYIEDPSKGFSMSGGLTFLGGLIGGIVTFLIIYFIFRKKYKTRLMDVVSGLPPCIMIGHAFGRLGCFFAGCCYGKPTDSFLGVQFPHLPSPVHPTMLYESAFLFILFGITFYLVMKKDFKHNLSIYLIGYGIFRFCNEYLRGDHRGELVAGISPSQFWSILMVVGGIAVYFLFEYLFKNHPTPLAKEKASGLVCEPVKEETLPPITNLITFEEETEEAEEVEIAEEIEEQTGAEKEL